MYALAGLQATAFPTAGLEYDHDSPGIAVDVNWISLSNLL